MAKVCLLQQDSDQKQTSKPSCTSSGNLWKWITVTEIWPNVPTVVHTTQFTVSEHNLATDKRAALSSSSETAQSEAAAENK